MKKLLNEYKARWRKEPGFMIVVHVIVAGGVVVIVLSARDLVVGLVALIAWLLILAAIVGPCLTMDLMRD